MIRYESKGLVPSKCGLRIAECGLKKKKSKSEIFLRHTPRPQINFPLPDRGGNGI